MAEVLPGIVPDTRSNPALLNRFISAARAPGAMIDHAENGKRN